MKHIKKIIANLLSTFKVKRRNVEKYSPLKIGEYSISISSLFEMFPPRYYNTYKQKIWSQINERWLKGQIAFGDEEITVSQYRGRESNFKIERLADSEIISVEVYFDYKASDMRTTVWYLNFADPNLFVAYGSNLFAQDEIQCLEHPLLGSLKEYMISRYVGAVSVSTITDNCPTPILLEGIPYMVEVNTAFNFGGIAYSIYGNAFRRAELHNPDILDMGIHVKDEVSLSNIIAMCAPCPETGKYRMETIRYLLMCAITAFGAAKDRTQTPNIEIHTGRWGAGAFGGNEQLAIIVQILAANICGIRRLVFHAVSSEKLNASINICKMIFGMITDGLYFSDLVSYLYNLEFEWGMSDGN